MTIRCIGNNNFKEGYISLLFNELAIGVEKQCELYSESKYCIFKRGKVSGNSNFTIGITCGRELKRVLYMLDSNGCRASDDPADKRAGYLH